MVMSKTHERGERDDTTLARMGVVTGVDLMDGLEKYRGAQKEAAAIRAELAPLNARLAQLKARYDGFDTSQYNLHRKRLWAQLAEDERKAAVRRGEKAPSDTALEKFAYAHPQYERHLEQGDSDRKEMEKLKADVAEVESRLETALGVVAYYDKVCRANDAVIGFARGEMGLQR